jgi:hypothetical protein
MSLASDYAALQATAASDLVTANQGQPPAFTGPNGHAEVTVTGGLRLVPGPGGNFEISSVAALAFAAWIVATFGEPG